MEQLFCKKCDSDKNYEEVKKNLNFCPDCNADLSAGIKPTSPEPTSPEPTETEPTETEHSHQYNAGKYLIKFQGQFHSGFVLSILGAGVSIIGALNSIHGLMYLGGGITFVGGIIMLVSVNDIGNAGEELMK